MSEWRIASSFLDPGYRLIEPGGREVGVYDSLEEAERAMLGLVQMLLEASLRETSEAAPG